MAFGYCFFFLNGYTLFIKEDKPRATKVHEDTSGISVSLPLPPRTVVEETAERLRESEVRGAGGPE